MSLSLLFKSCISEEELKDITLYDKSMPNCNIICDAPSFIGLPHKLSEPSPTYDKHTVEDVRDEDPQSDNRKSFYGIEITNQCQMTDGLTAYLKDNFFLNSYYLDAFSISSAFSNLNNFSVLPEKDAAYCSKHSEVSMKSEIMDRPSVKKLNMAAMVCNLTNKEKCGIHEDTLKEKDKKNISNACEAKIAIRFNDLDGDNTFSNIVPVEKTNLILSNKGKEVRSSFTCHIDVLNKNTSEAKEGKDDVHCNNSHLFETSKYIELEDSEDVITYILLSSDDSDFDEATEVMRDSFKNMSFLEYEDLTPLDKNTMEDSFKKSLQFNIEEMESNVKSSTPLKSKMQLSSGNDKVINGIVDSVIFRSSKLPSDDNFQVADDSSTLCVENNRALCNVIKYPISRDSEIMTADIINSPENLSIIQNDNLMEQNSSFCDSAPLKNVHSQLEKNQQVSCISIEVDHSKSFDLLIKDDVKDQLGQPCNMTQDAKITLTSPSNQNVDSVNKNQTKSSTINIGLIINDVVLKEESLNDNELHNAKLNISFHSLSLKQDLVNYSSNEILCDQSPKLKNENILSKMQPNNNLQNKKETATLHLEHGSKNSFKNVLKHSPNTHTSSINDLHQLNGNKITNDDELLLSDDELLLSDDEFNVLSLSHSYSSLFSEDENLSTSEALNENKDKLENVLLIAENGRKLPSHGHSAPALNVICCKENVCNVEKMSNSVIQEDFILEENEDQIKAYQVPFVSANEKENKDNNDPEWEFLKKLKSDEERYCIVRQQWKNLIVPDPNVNLTQYSFRWKQELKNHSESSDSSITSKRKRDEDDSDLLHLSKRRKFNNLKFNNNAIDSTEMMLYADFMAKQRDPQLNSYGVRQVEERYFEYKRQFTFARKEAEAMFNFYQGLPNQTIVGQEKIEKEQREIDYLYELFIRYYNWNGTVFNPIIKKSGLIHSRYRR